jgi:hypothetical protein
MVLVAPTGIVGMVLVAPIGIVGIVLVAPIGVVGIMLELSYYNWYRYNPTRS